MAESEETLGRPVQGRQIRRGSLAFKGAKEATSIGEEEVGNWGPTGGGTALWQKEP